MEERWMFYSEVCGFKSHPLFSCLLRLVVRTVGFHPTNSSSILLGDDTKHACTVVFPTWKSTWKGWSGRLWSENEYSHTSFWVLYAIGKADLNRRLFTIVCVNLVSSNLTLLIFYLAVEWNGIITLGSYPRNKGCSTPPTAIILVCWENWFNPLACHARDSESESRTDR